MTHKASILIATLVVILLVGYIIVLLVVLRRHKKQILSNELKTQHTFAFFLAVYKQQFYYFECIDFMRKLLLVGVFGLDGFWRLFGVEKGSLQQAFVATLVQFLFCILITYARPYKKRSCDVFRIASEAVIFLFFAYALSYHFATLGDDIHSSPFMLYTIIVLFLPFGIIIIKEYVKSRKQKQDKDILLAKLQSSSLEAVISVEEWSRCYKNEGEEGSTELKEALLGKVKKLLERPVTVTKSSYIRSCLFRLPVWVEDESMYEQLKEISSVSGQTIKESIKEIYSKMIATGVGQQIHLEKTFKIVNGEKTFPEQPDYSNMQRFPMRFLKVFDTMFVTKDEHIKICEADVLVPLLQLIGTQIYDSFRKKLERAVPSLHFLSNEDFCIGDRGSWCGTVCLLPAVKDLKRMQTKIENYREMNKNFERFSAFEEITDVLRCTFDCENVNLVWATWKQIEQHFNVEYLNNKMSVSIDNLKQPPNLHVLVQFCAPNIIEHPVCGEIQIHLRAIHELKQEEHIIYEIQRSKSGKELS